LSSIAADETGQGRCEAIMVVLEPEVAVAFPTAEAVNEALRLVMQLSKIPSGRTSQRRKRVVAGA